MFISITCMTFMNKPNVFHVCVTAHLGGACWEEVGGAFSGNRASLYNARVHMKHWLVWLGVIKI